MSAEPIAVREPTEDEIARAIQIAAMTALFVEAEGDERFVRSGILVRTLLEAFGVRREQQAFASKRVIEAFSTLHVCGMFGDKEADEEVPNDCA